MASMQRYTEAISDHAGRLPQRNLNLFSRVKEIINENKKGGTTTTKKDTKKSTTKTKKTQKTTATKKTQKTDKTTKTKKSIKSKKSQKTAATTTTSTTQPPITTNPQEGISSPTTSPQPSASPQPSSSPTLSTPPTSSPQPTSLAPTTVDCDTSNDNFAGVIGSGKPVFALDMLYQYNLETDENVNDVIDFLAPAVKDSIANYLAEELFPVCAPPPGNSRRKLAVSTSDFGMLDVVRRMETTGIYTLTEDAQIIGTCDSTFPLDNCFILQDSMILLTDSTNATQQLNDLNNTLHAIDNGISSKAISFPTSVRNITYQPTGPNLNQTSSNEVDQVVRNNGSNSNTVAIAMGSTFGILFCIVCTFVCAKFRRDYKDKQYDEEEEDSQASRDYGHVIGIQQQRYRYVVNPNEDERSYRSGGSRGRQQRMVDNDDDDEFDGDYQPKRASGGFARGGRYSKSELQRLSEIGSATEVESDMDEEEDFDHRERMM